MANKNTYFILCGLILVMGSFVVINALSNFYGFLGYLGFEAGKSGGLLGWFLAALVVIVYCSAAATISDVKKHMFKLNSLKVLAIIAAVCAGIVEEVVFRKWLMDFLEHEGFSVFVQILVSGMAFGLVHLIWGVKNIKAGVNAALSTFILGIALALVYWLSGRSLAPCIVAHFVISALIEPGLIIAAQNDRLGYWAEKEG